MKKIQPIKTAWMCIGTWPEQFYPDINSIAFTRRASIKKFVDASTEEWNYWKKGGWTCVKVSIDFTILTPKP